jgi:predicted O-linked N-acetylglucosamine transferase (SPINDLY family)
MNRKQRRADAKAGIRSDPAGEALNAALQHHQSGRLEEAATLYSKILEADPRHADANHLLGVIAFQLGRNEVAVDLIGIAIAANRSNPAFHSNLGNALNGMGRLDDALAAYDRALRLRPDYADAHYNRGNVLRDMGRLDDALSACDTALRLRPDYADASYSRGNVLRDMGRLDDALTAYDGALRLRPDYTEAYNNRGNALLSMGRLDDALAAYDGALRLRPDYADAHYNRGNVLQDMARLDDALAAYDTALRLRPDLAETHNNRGNTLREMGRLDDALAAYDSALRLRPDYADAHNNRGNALFGMGRLGDALAAYDTALHLRPDFADAHYNRGNALRDMARLDDALSAYDTALSLRPDYADAHSNKLLALHYGAFDARGAIAAQARAFGASVNRAGAPQAFANPPVPDRRLRIGYVSGDLRRHPVGYFLQSILRNHASDAVEVFCYSNNLKDDDLTASFQSDADHWRRLRGLTDEAAATLIRADAIDILVDMSGHTALNRLPLFARRPAPVQVSWLGYFGTTGLTAMDYVLADRFVVPPGEDDAFTEQVWRMPGSYLCFMPPDMDVPVRSRDVQGPITFGSFNNLAKLSSHTAALWARVVQSVPQSRLLLKTSQLADAAVCQAVRERFAGHGIEADRLVLEGPSPRADLLASYNRVDIALDPYPYGGGTTTAEALWMGAPVVTLRGGTWTGRVSESILSSVGLSDLVAGSQEAYVDLAATLAANQDRRTALHATLRSRLEASPFCDGEGFTRQLEDAWRAMWKHWCKAETERA